MTKVKKTAVVLLAILLIAGFALLPQAVSALSDRKENRKAGTAPVQSVDLIIDAIPNSEANAVATPGYMLRKLAMEQNMTSVPILPDAAVMTQAEALAAAREAMDIYVENSVFEWFEPTYSMAEPYLGIDPDNMSNSAIFWAVNFTRDSKEGYHSLFIHIDDQTGKILYIKYETFGKNDYPFYYPENQRSTMAGFVNAFLYPLGLEGVDTREYEGLVDIGISEENLSDGYLCTQYTFVDAQYGKICLEFHVTPSGFYVHYPK